MMKLVQTIYDNRTFNDKNGVQRRRKMFFLVSDSGKRIAIKPCFDDGYVLLDAYAEVEHIDSVKSHEEKK